MKRFLFMTFGLLCIVVAVAAGYGFQVWNGFLETEVSPPDGKVAVDVVPGTSLRALGRQLDEAGAIEDRQLPFVGSVFYLWAHKVEAAGPRIKAGEYLFEGPARPADVLGKIVRGEVRTYQVTIPEGLRLDEIFPLFEAEGLAKASELLALARDPKVTRALGVEAENLEGYVFPDTYTFAKGLSARKILEATVERFHDAWARAETRRQSSVKLTRHEAVTLASIIEKETGAPEERPRISCVFHNRLRDRWKLQTDPTVIYAKILWSGGTWDGNLTRADLERKHPYSTYTNYGLPPGPIASPGQAALDAALDPLTCTDMFFVSRNDGTHVFCPDYDCHLRAVGRYQGRGG